MHCIPNQASKADEKISKGILNIKLSSTSTIARLHATAARLVAKPPPMKNNASAATPVVENVNAGGQQKGKSWENSPATSGHIPRRVAYGVGVGVEDEADIFPSSSRSHADAVEQRPTNIENSDCIHSLSKGESCDGRDGTFKGECVDASCSDEESVDKNDEAMREVSEQVPTGWSSSDSDDWLFTEENAEPPLQPAGLYDNNPKYEARGDESPSPTTAVEEEGQTLLSREAPKRHFRHRTPRRHLRGSRRRSGAKAGAADSVNHDGSWSNRSLTVLFKELGLHQSCQRAVLSKHIPATFKGDEDGELQPEPLPLPRIDRPHFRPIFVELEAAGKGSTVRLSNTTL